MKTLRLFVCAVSLFSTLCVTAQAGDNVSIEVTGKVVASPCQINPDDLVKNIDLGQAIPAQDAAGAMGEPQNFTVTLTDCPSGTSNIAVTYTGAPASVNPDYVYANTATENAAKNVGVLLQVNDSGVKPLGNGKVWNVVIAHGSDPVLHMTTKAYSLGDAAPGNISSTIVMSFEYN